ncbi:MAG: DUF481 domain-containing protein [Arenicellales bacterium]|nr:DUF481 domain-containing protein [Arenicellales bacterium]
MRKSRLTLIFGTVFFLISTAMAPRAMAQELATDEPTRIELNSGSILLGDISGASAGKISFKSKSVGLVIIPIERVVRIRIPKSVVIKFLDGRVIRVPEFEAGLDPFEVITENGAKAYSLIDIDAVNPEDWLLGRGIHSTGKVRLSWEKQSGNTEKNELDYNFNASWENLKSRWKIRGEGELHSASNEKTSDKFTIVGKTDRFLTGHQKGSHIGTNILYETDEFSELKSRYILGLYYGKQWYTSPKFKFLFEPGLAFVGESRENTDKEKYPALSWEIEINSNLLGVGTETTLTQNGIQNLDNFDDIILNTLLVIQFPLISKFTLDTSFKFEYDSGVPATIDKMDETIKLGIGYRW